MVLLNDNFLYTPAFLWIERVSSLVISIPIILLFAVHTYENVTFSRTHRSKVPKQAQPNAFYHTLSHIYTIAMLFLNSLMTLHFTLNSWGSYSFSCDVIKKLSVLLLHLAKIALYLTLVVRLQVAFVDSYIIHNLKCIIRSLYVFVGIFFVITVICDPLIITGHYRRITNDISACYLDPIPLWGVAISVIFDLCLSVACLYFFDKPLKVLLRSINRNESFTALLQKYSILTTIAIISTFTSQIIIYLTGIGVVVLLDLLTNSMCLVLMSSWNQSYYDKLCFLPNACVNQFKVVRVDMVIKSLTTLSPKLRSKSSRGSNMDASSCGSGNSSNPNMSEIDLGTPLPKPVTRKRTVSHKSVRFDESKMVTATLPVTPMDNPGDTDSEDQHSGDDDSHTHSTHLNATVVVNPSQMTEAESYYESTRYDTVVHLEAEDTIAPLRRPVSITAYNGNDPAPTKKHKTLQSHMGLELGGDEYLQREETRDNAQHGRGITFTNTVTQHPGGDVGNRHHIVAPSVMDSVMVPHENEEESMDFGGDDEVESRGRGDTFDDRPEAQPEAEPETQYEIEEESERPGVDDSYAL